jgi:preprotein translocase subunit SecD
MDLGNNAGCMGWLVSLFMLVLGLGTTSISSGPIATPVEVAITQPSLVVVLETPSTVSDALTEALNGRLQALQSNDGPIIVYTLTPLANGYEIAFVLKETANPNQVIALLYEPSLLEFVDLSGLDAAQTSDLKGQRLLSSAYVAAYGQPNPSEGWLTLPDGAPFPTIFTGAGIAEAKVAEQANPAILISFTPEATIVLGSFTAANIGKALAIVYNGEVLFAPTIQSQLPRQVQLRLDLDKKGLEALAFTLNTVGRYPLPTTLILASIRVAN